MNGKWLRRWGPALVIVAVLGLSGARYRAELRDWFLNPKAGRDPEPGMSHAAHVHAGGGAAGGDLPESATSQPSSQPSSMPASHLHGSDPGGAASQPASQPASMPMTITIDEGRRQLIGVKLSKAVARDFNPTIRAVGRVTYDETSVTDVTLKLRGWIGAVQADFTGKKVRRGDPLFTLYAPELYSAQAEYLEALRQSAVPDARGTRLVDAARNRLSLWDLEPEHLRALETSGRPEKYVPILAPAGGTVIVKNVFSGSAVEPGALLYRIADLSRVWVEADVYESDSALIRTGQRVSLSSTYDPGLKIEGELSYIYPYMDAVTRTTRVRMEVDNGSGALRPEMYVNAAIHVPRGRVLAVPESAVIQAGERGVVFVDHGAGKLEPRRVEAGMRDGEWIEIVSGLVEGEQVVTGANFLVAAESNLSEAVRSW